LAGIGEKWTGPNRHDILSIMKSRDTFLGACHWRCLTLNALEILLNMGEHYQEAAEAAILGLGQLYEKDQDKNETEVITALVNFLREIMAKHPHLEQTLIVTILKLCPGLTEQDLKNAVPSAGNLGYVPSGVAMKQAQSCVDKMQEGEHEWVKLLDSANQQVYAGQCHGTSSDDLMICYSDLEPDDSMAIAQLWQWNYEQLSMKKEPVIIFGADFTDKDQNTVFEKKLLMTQLMVGTQDLYVCTPDQEFYDLEKSRNELKPPNHANHEYWEGLRHEQLDEVCNKLVNHEGANLLLYIMAPGRGNLGAIVAKLKAKGTWPLRKTWKIFLYSGAFNMKGMTDKDLAALKEISALAQQDGNYLNDVAKFPFFGRKDSHPVTDSFTTFAPTSFAADINMVAQPVLIALLKLLNDEHNMGLIKPDKLYRTAGAAYGKLAEHERERFAVIEALFAETKVQEYCKGIVNDFVLFSKVPDFKKSTIAAFAHGCCDSPLCDQLIFLIEYLKLKRPTALKDTEVGKWTVNSERGFTAVERSSSLSADDTRAIQPVLRDHNDMETLKVARIALQHYLLEHLRTFGSRSRSGTEVMNILSRARSGHTLGGR